MEKIIYNLRPMEEKDLQLVLEWRNSDRVRHFMYNDSLISFSEHRAWFRMIQNDPSCIYLIFEINTAPVGLVNLTKIDPQNLNCMMGFYVGRENCPKGTGTKMGELALRYAFNKIGIRKILGEVLVFNEPSIHFFLKLGFREEGRLIKHVKKNGVYVDVIVFGLLRDDYSHSIYTREEPNE